MSKVEEIIEQLKTLTLLEAAELVKEIEQTFNVDASAPSGGMMMMPASGDAAGGAAAGDDKTEFDVVLEDVPADKKIAVLKIVRGLTGLGLKEAKELVESAPKQIQEGLAKDAAEDAKKQIEDAGGKASLK